MDALIRTPDGHLDLVQTTTPRPGPGQMLVQVRAAAINPVDAQTLDGMYHDLGWVTQPEGTGLGWDAAGVVAEVGAGVDGFRAGDRVAVLSAGVDKPYGTFATHVLTTPDAAAPVPAGLSDDEAATVPLNGLTAWQALDLFGDARGTLLVTGAAGGVGGWACALASERGWTVLGLARASDADFVSGLDAELVTDLDGLRVDAVLDAAALVEPALDTVVDGGRYVGVLPPAVPAPRRGITPVAVSVTPQPDHLRAVLRSAAQHRPPSRVAERHPLSAGAEAMQQASRPGLRGRVVLHP